MMTYYAGTVPPDTVFQIVIVSIQTSGNIFLGEDIYFNNLSNSSPHV